VFHPVMRAVIADHLETGTRVVFEGDFLLPEMATLAMYGQEPNAGRVRALFVSEPDEAQIAANYFAREGGAEPERVRASWLFDAFLRDECARQGVALVDARPWDSVVLDAPHGIRRRSRRQAPCQLSNAVRAPQRRLRAFVWRDRSARPSMS
jgi:hypothetical protein